MHGRTTAGSWPSAAAHLTFIVLAAALLLNSPPATAADARPPSGTETAAKGTPTPPSVQIDITAADDDMADSGKRGKRHKSVIRMDSDGDFESFKDAVNTAPWIVGLVFLVVGSIFLTPLILLVGIVWYKLRKTRMQNDALIRLAEKGMIPAAQAADAVASGVMPAAGAVAAAAGDGTGGVYQQAVATRRRTVWSDLRKGMLLGAFGFAVTLYSIIEHGAANWFGLLLLFVGLGYGLLWWLEDRHLAPRDPPTGSG
jgi:hypothetical protein